MQNLNLKLFYIINNLSMKNKFLDKLMIFTSKYIIYIFMAILLLHFILSILHKNIRTKKIVLMTAFLTLINVFFSFIIGKAFPVNRPFIHHSVHLLYSHRLSPSFPSDHSIVTLTIALGILKYNKILGIILILLSAAVGFSRIYVGHHYPSDVIGGYILSLLTTYIFNKTLKIILYKNKRASI